MEFHEKLQELRKKRGLTQEELAAHLFVSRAAVSKWESGRGYPNMSSLKDISKFFSISLDDLLSDRELTSPAAEDQTTHNAHSRAVIFGLTDCSAILLFFFPFFAQRSDEGIKEVTLLALTANPYAKILCIALVLLLCLWGIAGLALQNRPIRHRERISLLFSSAAMLAFTAVLQPYAAVFCFIFLLIKAYLLLKHP